MKSESVFAEDPKTGEPGRSVRQVSDIGEGNSITGKLRKDHDMSLPAWGPYNKDYFGISHISSLREGHRFDVCVVPGRFRGEIFPPDTLRPSGWLPWDADAGLLSYSYRQQILWKDQVYVHVTMRPQGDGGIIAVDLVNQTDHKECLSLNLCTRMSVPDLSAGGGPVDAMQVILPPGAGWIRGIDYSKLKMEQKTRYYGLNQDAVLSGEVQGCEFTGGYGLGAGFGSKPGQYVCYRVPPGTEEILVRWRGVGSDVSRVRLSIGSATYLRDLALGSFSTDVFRWDSGAEELCIESENGQPLEIDGLAHGCGLEGVSFKRSGSFWVPDIEEDASGVRLRYGSYVYYIGWEGTAQIRQIRCNDIRRGMMHAGHNYVPGKTYMNETGHITDIFSGPIDVPPRSIKRFTFNVRCDKRNNSECPLNHGASASFSIAGSSHAETVVSPRNPCDGALSFVCERLTAVSMTNVVYPIRLKGNWVRHFSPGRLWNCLYTWDSGCIGLGLTTRDIVRATEILLAYLCEPGDEQTAFIHHGSIVPTQFYLAQEIWNRTQDSVLLEYLWPRLKQYYDYFFGKHPGSTMSPFASGLLAPWDYFYNSGGWDDYPPQHYLDSHHELRKYFAPCITNAHGIRVAKIMAGFASILEQDPASFTEDASKLSVALNEFSWDEESGFFGYVWHDERGVPCGHFHDEQGHFFNRGMDGLSPLIASAVAGQQAERMWKILLDEERFLTPVGLSTVDLQAPYFSKGGYWNGSVWIPYQWFFWKAMLDYGLAEAAHDLAKRVLKTYAFETQSRYYCWEHFLISSGQGTGWHHFSGLSAPLLNLFASYYQPGTITGGHDFFVLSQSWGKEGRSCSFEAVYRGQEAASEQGQERTLLVVMPAGISYRVFLNGDEVDYSCPVDGCLSLTFNSGGLPFHVVVEALTM